MNSFSGIRSPQSPPPKALPIVASSHLQPTIIDDAERIASAERFVEHLKKQLNDDRFSNLAKTLGLTNASTKELQSLTGHLNKGAHEILQGHMDWLKDIHHAPTTTYGPALGCDYGRPHFLLAYHEVGSIGLSQIHNDEVISRSMQQQILSAT